MRHERQTVRYRLFFWLISYPTFVLGVIVVMLLRIFGRVKIYNARRLPRWHARLIIASNHPSLYEPVLLMFLFPAEGILHPTRMIPWSTPDPKTYDACHWQPAKPRFVFVPRDTLKPKRQALSKIMRVLHGGHKVILFPEAGRTHKGKRLCASRKGYRIADFKRGTGRVACQTGADTLPIAVRYAEQALPEGHVVPRFSVPVEINVGHLILGQRVTGPHKQNFDKAVDEYLKRLKRRILDLLDEGG